MQPLADGGLALMADGGVEYSWMFGVSPPKSLDERPETTAELLKWLLPREKHLAELIAKDLETRDLRGTTAARALATLSNRKEQVFRRISYALLKKALYLFYYIEGKQRIALHDEFTALIDRAAQNITNITIDDQVLEHIGTTREEMTECGLDGRDERCCHGLRSQP